MNSVSLYKNQISKKQTKQKQTKQKQQVLIMTMVLIQETK